MNIAGGPEELATFIRCVRGEETVWLDAEPEAPQRVNVQGCDPTICRCGAWRDDRECLNQPKLPATKDTIVPVSDFLLIVILGICIMTLALIAHA